MKANETFERVDNKIIGEMFVEDGCLDSDSYFSGYRQCESLSIYKQKELQKKINKLIEVVKYYANEEFMYKEPQVPYFQIYERARQTLKELGIE